MVDPKRLKIRGVIKGKDGYTPIRGVDYMNADDRTEIMDTILALLPAAGVDYFDEAVELVLDDDPSDNVISIEVEGEAETETYGVVNATINEKPARKIYDFTVL